MFVHVFVPRSYVHVSLKRIPPAPPNRIARSADESYAIAGLSRPGGLVAGAMSVHVFALKSYAHVSLEAPFPLYRMTRSDRESYAMDCYARETEAGAGVGWVHVFDVYA